MDLTALRALLLADAGVRPLVGASRVYFLTAPEGAPAPYIVLQPLQTQPVNALDGWAGLDLSAVLIDSYGVDFTSTKALGAAARTCLQAQQILMQQETEDYDNPTRTFRVSQQWQIWT
ncbi:MAG TPA: DUF3168 domain-containing protein [Steroidobacteraceae bacterium]|nr:DUF3168 domain-containing protein [Steroidobacteraceae bacterium]